MTGSGLVHRRAAEDAEPARRTTAELQDISSAAAGADSRETPRRARAQHASSDSPFSAPSLRPLRLCGEIRPEQFPRAETILARLARSKFRSRFAIRGRELAYLRRLGPDKLRAHARDLITKRLAPAEPANDGRQTPMRNHPVFVAQHATATCCRGCLRKWHGIPEGQALSAGEVDWVVELIAAHCGRFAPADKE